MLRKLKALATSEDEFFARAGLRDPTAIAAITTLHNRRLFRVARSILRDDDAAEDALQAAYFKAFAALPSFRGEARLVNRNDGAVLNPAIEARCARRFAYLSLDKVVRL